jgi:DNA-binding XRE family transcriptional regulator
MARKKKGLAGPERNPRRRRQPMPTVALPGHPSKVKVLAARAERGEELHCKDDAQSGDDRYLLWEQRGNRALVPAGESAPAGVLTTGNHNLGSRIRQARLDRGISTKAFALRAGIDRSFLWKIESGRQCPGLASLLAIARVLGVTIDKLLSG